METKKKILFIFEIEIERALADISFTGNLNHGSIFETVLFPEAYERLGRILEEAAVFVLEGWIIGVVGTLLGMAIGLLLAGNVNEIFRALEWVTALLGDQGIRVFSPAYFYLEEIPRRVFPRELLSIAVGAIGISMVAARFAATSVIKIRPMELLRNE